METQGTPNSQIILKKKKKARGFTCPDFKTYGKALGIKTVQYWHKDRQIDHWNKIKSQKYKPSHIIKYF